MNDALARHLVDERHGLLQRPLGCRDVLAVDGGADALQRAAQARPELAVALAILLNEPVAIAYVVAIKGLGRYAELKETPAAAERFIIGTLTSLLWACAVAGLTAFYLL